MSNLQFEADNVTGYFDTETGLLRVTYTGVISAATTASVYAWGYDLLGEVNVKDIKGMITDFRAVEKFDYNNLRTASKESRSLNQKFDFSMLPVALLVKNMYQEQMVSISMKLTQQTQRMRMVHTEEEAINFLKSWHEANSPSHDVSEN